VENEYNQEKIRIETIISSNVEKVEEDLKKIDEYNNKIKKLEEIVSINEYINKEDIEKDILSIQNDIDSLNVKKGILQKIIEDRDNYQNKVENFKERLKFLEDNLYYLKVLGDAFKDIPTTILKDSISEIEEYSNEFIQSIYPGYSIKIYEDVKKQSRPLLVSFEVDGKLRNYKLLSGGQQSICAMGLRLGFNKTIATRAKISLDFLILDEIFSALDNFNRSEVLRTLISLNNFFPQIIVITHTEEATLFPNLIHVIMDSFGNSRIDKQD